MNAVGIIAEFNPFHNGHHYLVRKARELSGCDYVVAVMSGNYTQRGEPALINKHARAEAAVLSGVDLVIEMPVLFSLSSAERFAYSGIYLLNSLGICESFAFGCETRDPTLFFDTVALLLNPEITERIILKCGTGISFASAREKVIREESPACADLLRSPNNILGVEYIKAVKRLDSSMKPIPILRKGAAHNSVTLQGNTASASLIRSISIDDSRGYMPEASHAVLRREYSEGRGPVGYMSFESPMFSYLRRLPQEEFSKLPECREGLESRIYKSVRKGNSLSEIISLAKTKRYPEARIRRMLMYAYLGISSDDFISVKVPPYIKILAFNNNGRKMISEMRSILPVIVKPSSVKSLSDLCIRSFDRDFTGDDLYYAVMPSLTERIASSSYTMSPHFIDI